MSRVENITAGAQRIKPVPVPPAENRQRPVPRLSLKRVDAHLVSLIAPESPAAEQYRALRYAVECEHQPERGTLSCICSALPGDGKSITAINLAGALAQDSKARVLLMEVDLRRPSVTMEDRLALGNTAGRGLVDAILDPSFSLEEVVLHLPNFNLSVLPAGKRASAPYESLKSPRFGELLTQARQRYDYVILDAPPVVPVPDCRLLIKWVDHFIMVVAANRTPREAVDDALAMIEGGKLLGLVFNGYDRSASRYYDYGYGNGKDRQRIRW
jgi:capsular exopolysaccharide synthesis family protein